MIRRTLTAALLGAALLAGTAAPALAEAPHGWELQVMKVRQAQTLAQGKGVTVAVLDTGVMANHPAFRGRVTSGPDFVGGGARPGRSYWGAHGTAMASSVLAVAPQARVLSVRVIWDREDPARKRAEESAKKSKKVGQEESRKWAGAVAKGIRYAVDHDAKVISMSLGTDEWSWAGYEEDTAAAVDYASSKGVVVVASSGNGGSTDAMDLDANNRVSYPAAFPSVIGVAAAGPDGARAEFSQVHTYTTIAAPGVDIYAARNLGGYESGSGTSPAAALTSGTVALMLSRNPRLTIRQVREILTRTAMKPPAGYTLYLGHGIVDAAAAVQAVDSPPPAAKAVAYTGKRYLGGGPVGSPVDHPPVDSDYLVIGGTGLGVGLLCLVGAFLLFRRPRRHRAAR
ncbi:S8 family peptidase [Streptosporangium jomthongense]|uniref:S8 family serine peptidase n=1 Tax=Streptosporangium jomthongense TaxID=1193683 RepID=A0ABV8F8V6_9ACTN